MKNKIVVSAIFCLALSSCGKSSDSESSRHTAAPTTVEIESLSSDGCLNIPAYFQSIQAMSPTLPVLEVSTDFDVSSRRPVRPNFRKLLAYSTFTFATKPLSSFHEFTDLSQEGCSTVTFTAADGTEEEYKVIESSTVSILARHEDGRSLRYTWLGPQRMEIDMKYFAYDMPCTMGEAPPILVRHNRVLDWSQSMPSVISPGNSPFSIEHSYLADVADAVGVSLNSIYDTGPEGERMILAAQAQQLQHRSPREEILTCGASYAPSPSPQPEDGTDPAPGGDTDQPSAPETPSEPEPAPAPETTPETPEDGENTEA